MDLVARVILTGFESEPVETALALEGYDLRQKSWRAVPDILKPLPAAPKVSRDGTVHRIAFALNEVAITALFAATAFFRLVTPTAREGGLAQVILASPRIVWSSERVEVDFGTVLFLGQRGGFVIAAGDGGAVCSGVALAEDAALAAAQRRFYAGPGEGAAERDRIQARLAELESANAAAAKALSACEATRTRLTRDNAALTQQVQKAAADFQVCVAERGKLTEQLTAATARAATAAADLQACTAERGKLIEQLAAAKARATTAETGLKACIVERERAAAELAAQTKALATATADLQACAVARGKLTEQLAAAAARAATAETGLKACTVERERAAAELAAQTKALATATADLQACTAERGKLIEQLAAATARATTAETGLKACTAERERAATELAAQTRALATATADLQACTAERGKLNEQLAAATARAKTAETGLKTCTIERERAATELADRTSDLATVTAERDACAAARQALVAELAEARAAFDATMKQLEERRAEFSHAVEAGTKAGHDLEVCRARSAELEAAIRETGAALEASRLAATEAERRTGEAERAHVALNDRLLAMEAETKLRAGELAELRDRISDERAYVGRLRETLIAETARAGVAVEQLEAVRSQHRSETPATQLIANLATSFGRVNHELLSSDVPFRLGRTDIRLKTILSGDGERMLLPDAGYRIQDAALSEISMELIPNDAATAPAARGLVVPDLLGLTETAVIRVLSSLALKADKAIETVVGAPEKHGRALHQIPGAGAPAEKGQTVLVVYGALEGG